jgi:5-formyltetrahydrofolate cyclo-ligase
MRARRAALDSAALQQAERALGQQLWHIPSLRHAHRIGVYWPMRGEISPWGLLHSPWAHRQQFFLPVLTGLYGRELRFAPFAPRVALVENRLGIPEPQVARRHWRAALELDVLILPLLAFDGHGQRLGMGGGFYDRSLAALRHRRRWRRPRLLGVAHAFQEVTELPREPWDVPLDGIVTEQGYRSFRL